jgi:hypothetical protein
MTAQITLLSSETLEALAKMIAGIGKCRVNHGSA